MATGGRQPGDAQVARMGQEIGNSLVAVSALYHQARLQARQGHLFRAREFWNKGCN